MDIEIKDKPNYQLAQSIGAHSSAVRTVNLHGSDIISGSTDKTVKLFSFLNGKYELINTLDFFTNYIYSSCVLFAGGYAIGCGNQIYLIDFEGNPIGLLEGHEGQVCSLHSPNANRLVSGSWDATAIVWDLGNQTQKFKLQGHKYGVAVLGLDEDETYATASQDGILRLWYENKEVKKVQAHTDIVREIVQVPHVGLLTCSNDELLKLWSKDLELIGTFVGHTGFIFSVKVLNTTNGLFYVSGSDDNSVKVWDGACELVQSISLPGTVWTVSVNTGNGDIVAGCVDGKLRVFTLDPKRRAVQGEIDEFESEVQLSVAQGPSGLSVEELEKMPGIEKLGELKGKKNGEVRLFKNGKKPEVYAWSEEGQKWDKIGDVIGGSAKKQYPGDKYFQPGEYDYVFDVEDDSGVPKLIPFNDGDSYTDVAERFCMREGFSKAYLQQVINFLKQNTKPVQAKAVTVQKQQYEYIPYTQVFLYEQMNLQGLQKKLVEFNGEMGDNAKLQLNEKEVFQLFFQMKQNNKLILLTKAIELLGQTSFYHTSSIEFTQCQLLSNKLMKWPSKYLLPVYDLLRVFSLHHSSEQMFSGLDGGIQIFLDMNVMIREAGQNQVLVRLAIQALCNFFKHNANTFASIKNMSIIKDILPLGIQDEKVIGNLLLNASIGLYQHPTVNTDASGILTQIVVAYLKTKRDDESVAKGVTALGNLSQCGDSNVRKQCKANLQGILGEIKFENNESGVKCLREVQLSFERIQ